MTCTRLAPGPLVTIHLLNCCYHVVSSLSIIATSESDNPPFCCSSECKYFTDFSCGALYNWWANMKNVIDTSLKQTINIKKLRLSWSLSYIQHDAFSPHFSCHKIHVLSMIVPNKIGPGTVPVEEDKNKNKTTQKKTMNTSQKSIDILVIYLFISVPFVYVRNNMYITCI